MDGWFGVPSWPIAVGSPATLLITSVASAPAFCAFRIFTEKAHVPRETTAILPLNVPAGKAEHARPSDEPPSDSGAVRSDATVWKSPLAAAYVVPPAVTGAPTKWPTVNAPAV